MKHLLILAILLISASAISQTVSWNGNYNVADFYSQGTSTFFLGAAKGVKQVTLDFTNFNANTAIVKIGSAAGDIQGWCGLTFYDGTETAVDSVVLNVTTDSQTTKNAFTGTNSTVSRIYALFPDGLYSDYIAINIQWKTVTSGRLKIRLEPQK